MGFEPGDPNAGVSSIVEGIAWGKSPGSSAPALYGMDVTSDLVRIDPATGLKTSIGPVPAFAGSGSGAGFTFSWLTGTAYVEFGRSSGSGVQLTLYTVDLDSGVSALAGNMAHFPTGLLYIAAANVQSVPEPGGLSLAAAGLLAMGIFRPARGRYAGWRRRT